MRYDIITILGPTASGKTSLATRLARRMGNAEIISADSRQVYRGMDIGTGKDLAEYTVDNVSIPYHLIDIAEAGEKYNLFQFQQDFWTAYNDIRKRGKVPILCGGTGLYIESVLKSYKMVQVPENPQLRHKLEGCTLAELTRLLATYKALHNTTDVDTTKRAVRAIEIQQYYLDNNVEERDFPSLRSMTVGVSIDREARRQKITRRLHDRMGEGMLQEVERLLRQVPAEDLMYYGLEYKYLTMCCLGQLTQDEMLRQLEIAIHQFAKRQMTWFRGMERRGIPIHWMDACENLDERVERIIKLLDE